MMTAVVCYPRPLTPVRPLSVPLVVVLVVLLVSGPLTLGFYPTGIGLVLAVGAVVACLALVLGLGARMLYRDTLAKKLWERLPEKYRTLDPQAQLARLLNLQDSLPLDPTSPRVLAWSQHRYLLERAEAELNKLARLMADEAEKRTSLHACFWGLVLHPPQEPYILLDLASKKHTSRLDMILEHPDYPK